MIGDPMYDALQRQRGRREAKARRPAAPPRPEGVTVYRCNGIIADETPEQDTPAIWRQGCGATFEQKPYVPRPWCHGSPARIQSYDWERDVT